MDVSLRCCRAPSVGSLSIMAFGAPCYGMRVARPTWYSRVSTVVSYRISLFFLPWRRRGCFSSSCSLDSSLVSCRQSSGTSPPSQKSRASWSPKTSPTDAGGPVARNISNVARARAARRPLHRDGGRKAVRLARDNRSVVSRILWDFLTTWFIRGILTSRRKGMTIGTRRRTRPLPELWARPRLLIKTGRPQSVDVCPDLQRPTP